jgi:hypothetical protein
MLINFDNFNFILLILAFMASSVNFQKTSKASSRYRDGHYQKCVDPSTEVLEELYAKFLIKYRRWEEDYLHRLRQSGASDSPMPTSTMGMVNEEELFEDKHFVDDSLCDMDKRNQTRSSTKAMCTWVYKVTERWRRFPRLISQVKCTCSECWHKDRHLSRDEFRCMPVVKRVPVLVRSDECDKNGVFKWTPTTELWNVACTCSQRWNMVLAQNEKVVTSAKRQHRIVEWRKKV